MRNEGSEQEYQIAYARFEEACVFLSVAADILIKVVDVLHDTRDCGIEREVFHILAYAFDSVVARIVEGFLFGSHLRACCV